MHQHLRWEEVERVYYPEIEKLLLDFFPNATDALVYNHDVFDKDYQGDRTEDQDGKNPGVNANYANLVHNDLNDNSGRVRCRELLTKNLRNFGCQQHYTEEEADAEDVAAVHVDQPRQADRDGRAVPLCALRLAFPFADQPYITNYRIYDDRVGETTRFTYRPDHEWYWFPQQKPTEVSMLKWRRGALSPYTHAHAREHAPILAFATVTPASENAPRADLEINPTLRTRVREHRERRGEGAEKLLDPPQPAGAGAAGGQPGDVERAVA
jgi:hypothetical protein